MEQRRGATGNGEHSGLQTRAQVINAVEHVHVYEVVRALQSEGLGAERHSKTTALMR